MPPFVYVGIGFGVSGMLLVCVLGITIGGWYVLDLTETERDELASLDTRDLAFQVWALQADRKPTKTVAILADEFGMSVDGRTVISRVERSP